MLVLDEKELILERKKLEKVNKILLNTIDEMSGRVLKQKEKVKEYITYSWENKGTLDVQELAVIRTSSEMEANILLREQRYFLSLMKSKDNPYFGSIIFEEDNKENLIYIGMTHLVESKSLENIIYDWRSPICSLFYDYDIGDCYYMAPKGKIEGYLKRKRQYNIKDSKLIRMFDNSINISDDILQEILEKESSEKMENIVNTIQKEQNYIIRGNENNSIVIQGVAGSGKTSVALHRIAFLLYKIENLSSRNVLIFSPNNVFTEYISNVLPELGEENTLQTTFNDYLYNVITEYKHIETFSDFISRYYTYKEKNIELVKYKQSDQIIDDINNYIKAFIDNSRFERNIIENDEFIHEAKELNNLLHNKYDNFPLFSRIKEISNKLCERDYKGNKQRAKTYGRLLKEACNFNIPLKTIYYNFFNSKYCKIKLSDNQIADFVNKNKINYEDALLFAYMKSMLYGFHYEPNINQVVIDEAQDYNMLQYIIISKIFKKAHFTILGDINQTINPYYKYEDLNILNDIFNGIYIKLNKSYRSSQEIIAYSNNILNIENVEVIRKKDIYPVIIRENIDYLYEDIERMSKVHKSLAIITKDDKDALYIYNQIKEKYKVTLIDKNSKEFSKKFIVIPSYLAKGLEFDSVIVFNKSKYNYEDRFLLYVASTRAQHELVIYN